MMRSWSKPIDFFARRPHFLDHMLPIWNALGERERGSFYLPAYLGGYARERGLQNAVLLEGHEDNALNVLVPNGIAPILVAAYGDLQSVRRNNPQRPVMMMEHGVGLTFNHVGYADGTGMRRGVKMFLAPNEHVRKKTEHALSRETRQIVVGVPKMDPWVNQRARQAKNAKPVAAIAFHWDGSKVAPEAGNAFEHYRHILPALARRGEYHLLGHAHPRFMHILAPLYKELGIEIAHHFDEVLERADLYVNDCSSTMYEFLVTGKPVVILNAPWFRRDVKWGIRFWEYADVGPQVERAEDLPDVIAEQLCGGSDAFAAARKRAVRALYPHAGSSAARAAGALAGFVEGKR